MLERHCLTVLNRLALLHTWIHKFLPNVVADYLPPPTQQVPVEAAIEAIRGRLVGARLSLVTAAFTRLRGSGNAPPDAAAAVNVAVQFVPTGHPDVTAGRRSPEASKRR